MVKEMKIYIKKYIKRNNGFTLMEALISLAMLAVLGGVIVVVYGVVIKSFLPDLMETRVDIGVNLERAMESMAYDLRMATDLLGNTNEIRFSYIDPNDDVSHDVYYFNGNTLEKAKILGGAIDGAINYNSAQLIINDLLLNDVQINNILRTASNISVVETVDSKLIAKIDLTIAKNDEYIRMKTVIRPRNIQ